MKEYDIFYWSIAKSAWCYAGKANGRTPTEAKKRFLAAASNSAYCGSSLSALRTYQE